MAAGKIKFKKFTCGLDTSYSSKSPDTIAMVFQGITTDRRLITLAEKVYSNKDLDQPLAPSDTAVKFVEFLEKCRAAYPDAGLTELTQIEIVSRDAAEYVTKIKVAGETYDGEQFRHALELPSACFTITEMDDHVRIVARGMGHGFGLSQNTAEELAKEGYGYREILAYFYKGAVIGQAGNL